MELFDKFYCCYYTILNRLLHRASHHPISLEDIDEICRSHGFEESRLTIRSKITSGSWPLFSKNSLGNFSSNLKSPPEPVPLTNLQRSWLRSLLTDPRLPLFLSDEEQKELEQLTQDTEPLYTQEQFDCFDQFRDGDSFHSPRYKECFHTILMALERERLLLLSYQGKNGRTNTFEVLPCQLQYSSLEDKFRLCCLKSKKGVFCRNTLLNLERIQACHLSPAACPPEDKKRFYLPVLKVTKPLTIAISEERNALERCMLHFASYEKHTEYDSQNNRWICSIYYDKMDEPELLIDVLSFGPVIRVLGPDSFIKQIEERVRRQHELLYL